MDKKDYVFDFRNSAFRLINIQHSLNPAPNFTTVSNRPVRYASKIWCGVKAGFQSLQELKISLHFRDTHKSVKLARLI